MKTATTGVMGSTSAIPLLAASRRQDLSRQRPRPPQAALARTSTVSAQRVADPVIGSQRFKFSASRQPPVGVPLNVPREICAQFGHSVRWTASWSPDSRLVVVSDTCWPHRGQGDSLTALDKALFLRLVDRDLASDRVRLPLRHIPPPIRLACRRLVRAINCPLKRLGECCRLA